MNTIKISDEKKYWFLLDYKKTELAFKNAIDVYNNNLMLEYYSSNLSFLTAQKPNLQHINYVLNYSSNIKTKLITPKENGSNSSSQELFRKKYNLKQKQTYKALTIKSSEETTLHSILKIFGGTLHRNSYTKLAPESFRINNKAVCTQKNAHIHKRTSQRHISKLINAGLIVEKIFKGTKSSFEVIFNQNLVHFKPNIEWNYLLVELYKSQLNNPNVNPRAFSLLYSFSATLANFPLGYGVASCRLNSTSTILQVHKINIESGIVNYDFPLPSSSTSENQINNNFFKNFYENKESQKTFQSENTPPVADAPPSGADEGGGDGFWINPDLSPELTKFFEEATKKFKKQDAENKIINQKLERAEQQNKTITTGKTEDDKLWKHVLYFYSFAIGILWNTRIIGDYERNRICSNIYQHFKKRLGNRPIDEAIYQFRGEFMFRILLTEKYCKENVFWDLESPKSYFRIDHKAGFNGTLQWVDKSKKMEQEKKLYLEDKRIFIQAWKDYTKTPDVATYNLCLARIGRLKKECWKTYFLNSVANLNQFNPKDVSQIWQQHYRA